MLDDWRDRREEKRGKKQALTPEAIASAVAKALNEAGVASKKGSDLDELAEKWEKRFTEFQTYIEKLLLGKKAEEAEEKAERLEKELKEIKQKEEQEKLLKERIQEAMTPYNEQIAQLQGLLAEKTKDMSENERKGFFQTLGEQIEQSLSKEVSDTIAKNVAQAITDAFTPREEKEVPVTPEGKVDTVKMVDKWVREGLKAVQSLAQRWPQQKPPLREVQKITPTVPPPEATTTAAITPPEITSTAMPPPTETTTTATISPAPPTPTIATPEAKPEIPEQPKQEEAKPETEEKQPARAKPRKHRETTEESTQKQEP
jgi:hypothetical protein